MRVGDLALLHSRILHWFYHDLVAAVQTDINLASGTGKAIAAVAFQFIFHVLGSAVRTNNVFVSWHGFVFGVQKDKQFLS